MNKEYDMEKIHLKKPNESFVKELVDDFYDYLVENNHKSITEKDCNVFAIPNFGNNPTLIQVCDVLNEKCKENGESTNYVLTSVPDEDNGWGGLKGIYDSDYAIKQIRKYS